MKKLLLLCICLMATFATKAQTEDKKWNIGLHGGIIQYNGDLGRDWYKTDNNMYGFGGLVVKLSPAVNMRPSFVVKYVNNAPISVDGNLSFLFYDKLWIGGMYRLGAAAGANIMYNVTQNFRIGYAYDYTLNTIQRYSAGSHEIMLSYDFRSLSKGFKSPRYF